MTVAPDPTVKILLSVRDGADYLDDLIDSIRGQDFANWVLVIADDGSVDGSGEIIERHRRDDDRITVAVVREPAAALGPARSFMELLNHVGSGEVFAFCDQDDVWFPHKLSWTLAALRRLGSLDDIAAVATDAIVTDASLRVVAPSALALHGVRDSISLGRLFVNNVAIGATLCGTGKLAQMAVGIGRHLDVVRMHDWWCVLLASYAGSFQLLPAATMYWRRHEATVTGRAPTTLSARVDRRLETFEWARSVAATLSEHVDPIDDRAAKISKALAAIEGPFPTPRELLKVRRTGVRAWSARADANLLTASAIRPIVHRFDGR